MESSDDLFGVIDYIVLCATFLVSMAIGIYQAFVGGKQKTNLEFLLANRNMNPFPVAMSFTASFVSAPAVLGIPGEVYINGVDWILNSLALIIAGIITCRLFIPIYFRLEIVSAYEYLELRFNKHVRMCGVVGFILLTTLFMATVMYGPALALNVVTGISLWGSIIVTGLVCNIYTSIGGMKAVLFTDCFQAALIVAGILAAVIEGWRRIGDLGYIYDQGVASGRINIRFDPDPSIRHTFWSVLVGGVFFWLQIYAVNQTMVQRYLTLRTARRAKIAVSIGIVCVALIFALVCVAGLTMYAYYEGCDPLKAGLVQKGDQIIVYYVLDVFRHIPGISGLFVAAVFNATLSTVSSGINALAAVTVQDILKPILKERSELRMSQFAKTAAFAYGILTVFLSYVLSLLGSELLTLVFNIFGLIGGPLLGLFCLGMFIPWTNSKGAISGYLFGFCLVLWILIGAIVVPGGVPPPKLPRSTSMCSLDDNNVTMSITTLSTSTLYTSSDTSPTVLPVSTTTTRFGLYNVSYAWYTCIGCLSTVVVGLIVSLITGPTDPKDVDPKTFLSISDAMYCCCPEVCKHFFRCGISRYSEENNENADYAGEENGNAEERGNYIIESGHNSNTSV